MTRRRPGAAKGGGSPPPETDDFGRERALREGDPPPLPNRETDVFEGPGEGSGAPGDLKSRVHASKSMTCASKCDMESTFNLLYRSWTSHHHSHSSGRPVAS